MHKPVLLKETVDALDISESPCVIVDATVNRGGHSKEVLARMPKGSALVCLDLDGTALAEAKEVLEPLAKAKKVTLTFVQENFRNIQEVLLSLDIEKVDGLIADLGVSSQELDSSERGFSFRFDEPLYMTLKDTVGEGDVTAQDVVNEWSLETLTLILSSFSDERYAYRIAKEIVKQREIKPITTTFELIEIIKKAVPKSYHFGKTHFATKSFQAIRMAVNDELGALTKLIDTLPHILKVGRRAGIITFHSTEDRTVKYEVRKRDDTLTFLNRKATMPSDEEIKNNVRARSAQLRIIERI